MSNNLPLTYSEEQLRKIIRSAGEDNHIDAKRPMKWDNGTESAKLAKDIAAFANSRDGGFLILGKEEPEPGKFNLKGLTSEQATSFDTTKVAAWINSRFSPDIHLTCHPVQLDGDDFVVIHIREFGDIPVICTKRYDNPQDPKKPFLEKGRIYVRTANAESKPLQEEGELRDLVGLATKKQADVLLQHFNAMLKGRAIAEEVTDRERFENELEVIGKDLVERGSVDEKSGWTFFFHPVAYRQERWPNLSTLEDHVRRCSVRTTDTFPASRTGTFRTEWGIANDTYGETWALARSGTFFFHTKFREDSEHALDAIRQDVRRHARKSNEWKYQQFVEELDNFRWIEYEWNKEIMIQSFAFMKRLADLFEPGEAIRYRFAASSLRNRHLMSLNARMWFDPVYHDPCGSSRFSHEKTLSVEDVLATWQDECAAVMYRFFELFPDYNITEETLRTWVDRYTGKGKGR